MAHRPGGTGRWWRGYWRFGPACPTPGVTRGVRLPPFRRRGAGSCAAQPHCRSRVGQDSRPPGNFPLTSASVISTGMVQYRIVGNRCSPPRTRSAGRRASEQPQAGVERAEHRAAFPTVQVEKVEVQVRALSRSTSTQAHRSRRASRSTYPPSPMCPTDVVGKAGLGGRVGSGAACGRAAASPGGGYFLSRNRARLEIGRASPLRLHGPQVPRTGPEVAPTIRRWILTRQ